jgi:hypothetical protein
LTESAVPLDSELGIFVGAAADEAGGGQFGGPGFELLDRGLAHERGIVPNRVKLFEF